MTSLRAGFIHSATEIDLLPGETVICREISAKYMGYTGACPGQVIVTCYRVVFMADPGTNQSRKKWSFDVPLGHISKVDKVGYATASRSSDAYGLVFTCKDYRTFRFSFKQTNHGRRALFDALLKYSFPTSCDMPLFAYQYCLRSPKPSIDGWKVYDVSREFERLGVVKSPYWTILEINKTYTFSETYPSLLAIPTASAEEGIGFIQKVAEFRSRQRLPVLSWMNKDSQATISRSSQPLSGMTNRRSQEDEKHLYNIVLANGNCHQLLIFDARPPVNAKVNRAKGGGYEENYDRCSLKFLNIQNIHVVRESLKKVCQTLQNWQDTKGYWKIMDDAKWLSHLKTILDGAARIVYDVEQMKQSVLVHCSDGWDRTAQLTSLAMLQLDDYYRTIEGFAVLIEKEWCSFGHKFQQRIGHGDDKSSDGERSPIFVQFLDCVHQVLYQHPNSFEFTDILLFDILDELYSCRFGTFLFNCERERIKENKCHETTISLWSYIFEHKHKYINPTFVKSDKNFVLVCNSAIKSLGVWQEYYFRLSPHVVPPHVLKMRQAGIEHAAGRKQLLIEIADLQKQSNAITI